MSALLSSNCLCNTYLKLPLLDGILLPITPVHTDDYSEVLQFQTLMKKVLGNGWLSNLQSRCPQNILQQLDKAGVTA